MAGESSGRFSVGRGPSRAAGKASRAFDKVGRPATGRVHRLLVGQGQGFIRLADNREVFFHRSDMIDGTSLGELREGDAVAFDLLDDPISGPRGMRVRRDVPAARPARANVSPRRGASRLASD